MEAQKKALEHRWEIILGRRVRLTLKGYDKPIEGVIRLDTKKTNTPTLDQQSQIHPGKN